MRMIPKAVRSARLSTFGVIRGRLVLAFGLLISCTPRGAAEPEMASATQLKHLSIDDLMAQEVVTVSRRPEKLQDVASGLVVITNDDVQRSGAMILPQVLRLASNLQVAQSDARNWAVTARGSNNTTANKLLVMIDGRTVYTPLFAGVFWDAQQVYLTDVDRIEVVSGPGATSWGTNAVNGVINVVSKRAGDTQGAHLFATAGTDETFSGGVRYGGRVGDLGHYRVYATGLEIGPTLSAGGSELADAWQIRQAGFRMDLFPTEARSLSVHGDVYRGRGLPPSGDPVRFSGGNVVLNWTEQTSAYGELQVKVYYDESRRRIPQSFDQRLRIYDLDVQYRHEDLGRHSLVVGAGYRGGRDRQAVLPALAFLPPNTDFAQYNAFLQDEWALFENRVRLTAGVKVEHSAFGGNEWQPSIRGAFSISEHQTVWTAISRAVRAPSRIDRDFFVPASGPYFLGGGAGFHSEKLWAYEAGYRARLTPAVSLSATLFHHDYYSLRTVEPGPPATVANGANANTTGLELTIDYRMTPEWRWRVGYLGQDRDVHLKPWSRDLNAGLAEASDPRQQLLIGWSWDAGRRLSIDGQWRFVDELPTVQTNLGNASAGPILGRVPAYQEVDLRVSYRLGRDWEASVVGRNLLHPSHGEFGAAPRRSYLQRSLSFTLTWSR